MMDNPCKTCTRVENPEDCAMKQCSAWKQWFLKRWASIHTYYRAYQKFTEEMRGKQHG
jgi:hypothetical protein